MQGTHARAPGADPLEITMNHFVARLFEALPAVLLAVALMMPALAALS